MSTKVIFIEVSGPVGSGKTAVIVSIKELLEKHGYFVAVLERDAKSARNLENAVSHELPSRNETLFAITERVSPK
jgi:Ni2+-binding GTPase involved in maturation of urease and hydrogenase